MGVGAARAAPPSAGARWQLSQGRPLFFVASCPDESVCAAAELASRYGGFYGAVLEDETLDVATGTMFGTKVASEHGLAAWRGRVEAQFVTLRQMTPPGAKVVGVAIAGFGICNQQRELLCQLRSRRGFEQLDVKQCGDVEDMERWLLSEGYDEVRDASAGGVDWSCRSGAGSFGCGGKSSGGFVTIAPPAAAVAFPGPGQASRSGIWSSLFGADVQAARRETALLDVHRAMEEADALGDDSGPEALRAAASRLHEAAVAAQEAGVAEAELQAALDRVSQLQGEAAELEATAAQSKCCGWPWCVFCAGRPEAQTSEARFDETVALSSGARWDGEETIQARRQQEQLEDELRKLRLPDGTKCKYSSTRWNGWVSAIVTGFDANAGTYDLDVKDGARLELISPDGRVTQREAWPIGSPVSYKSDTAGGRFLPAVIEGFNAGADGADGTYDLDIKARSACERIRPRLL